MTRTLWLAACAAALLLGGSTARAQCPSSAPSCDLPCAAQTPADARAPYYHELPQMLFPPHAAALCPISNPAVWARLFEAVASHCCEDCADAACGPCERHRHASWKHRMACELLRFFRAFCEEGDYFAAAAVAGRAVQLDPSYATSEVAQHMASHPMTGPCGDGDAEDCEAPAPCYGMCGGCAASAACKGCGKSAARASCACGKDCGCGKDEPCACGADCCCKESRRQNVRRVIRQVVVVPMMCPACPFCPEVPAALPHPVAPMMPPAPGMIPPAIPPMMFPPAPMNVMVPHPMCPPAPRVAVQPCMPPMPYGQAERLPAPRLVDSPMAAMGLVSAPASERTRGPIRISVCGAQVCLRCPGLEACCNNVTSLPDGRALLEGDVCLTFTRQDRPAKVQAQRMIVDLEDGSFEVSPKQIEAHGIQPISHTECPCVSAKKKLLKLKALRIDSAPACKPCCPPPCVPCGVPPSEEP
jgi:hypothetical protein